ncbi:hypothetical protein D3C86_1580430 [compost metagenome]
MYPLPAKVWMIASGNAGAGMPPRLPVSRKWPLKPSQGAIAARCGGCSAAMNHCDTASHELPAIPILPELQGCSAAHSMKS